MHGLYGVVHTLGTLLETEDNGDGYKAAVRAGDLGALVAKLISAHGGGNPLERGVGRGSYEVMNRDSGAQLSGLYADRTIYSHSMLLDFTALRVCETFLASEPQPGSPFVYISAEDIFRPLIPKRYITTKRAAERGIADMLTQSGAGCRGVYIRPSTSSFFFALAPSTTGSNTNWLGRPGVPRSLPPTDCTACCAPGRVCCVACTSTFGCPDTRRTSTGNEIGIWH
jgi:hypothetical protein